MTPFRRFYFNRFPFRITSAPEHFKKRTLGIIEGLEKASTLSNDFLVHEETKEELDQNLRLL